MEDVPTENKIYTITEITRKIKSTIEDNYELNKVWIMGEISNLTHHSSGHIYFTLKDKNAVISVVFFKYVNKNLKFKLEEGMSVLAFGNITLYEKSGRYQINISRVRLEGIGELQQRIEQLKKKLLGLGIFDDEHKKPIPFLPKRIGIVTSPTGAAVRDIIKVALRRYPNMEVIIAPAKVQGEEAALSIVKGIEELNRPDMMIDVIIAGRGGGSFEDLMPFNEEEVVMAFYNSSVPIISAVGHQIDHPLCDDAADMNAPTPSAAAELAVPIKGELDGEITYLLTRAGNSLDSQLREGKTRLHGILSRRIFREPQEIIDAREFLLDDIEKNMISSMRDIIKDKSHQYNMAIQGLENLSPLGVMKRGFSIAMDEGGRLIKNIHDTDVGNKIELKLYNGKLGCTVNSKEEGDNFGKEKGV
ncbi:exodeoxyribonuclease VII large subunit [Spirochaetota bacterium]